MQTTQEQVQKNIRDLEYRYEVASALAFITQSTEDCHAQFKALCEYREAAGPDGPLFPPYRGVDDPGQISAGLEARALWQDRKRSQHEA